MAVLKPQSGSNASTIDPLPSSAEDGSIEPDDRRLAELLKRPGVTVRRHDPELANRQHPPIGMVGTMSMAELRWMLGRIDDDELEAERRAERRSTSNRSS